MPVTGRPQVDASVRRNRVQPKHDWIEVADTPFDGEVPVSLPSFRRTTFRGETSTVELGVMTSAWWAAVSTMPHCVLWTPTDWQFALATAIVADAAFDGESGAAAELRQREAIIGTTVDTRRKLMIRYVDPASIVQEDPEATQAAAEATVTILDDRRRRLTGT